MERIHLEVYWQSGDTADTETLELWLGPLDFHLGATQVLTMDKEAHELNHLPGARNNHLKWKIL